MNRFEFKNGVGLFFENPQRAHNNRVCDIPISRCDVGVAPGACFIIEIKIDFSRHTAQTHNDKEIG